MVYSSVPITAVSDQSTFALFVYMMVCSALLVYAFSFCFGKKYINIMEYTSAGLLATAIVGACLAINDNIASSNIIVPQHKVTAHLINLATDSVKSGKNSVSTIAVSVYEVENGDIVTFPIKFGTAVPKDVVLYVKD